MKNLWAFLNKWFVYKPEPKYVTMEFVLKDRHGKTARVKVTRKYKAVLEHMDKTIRAHEYLGFAVSFNAHEIYCVNTREWLKNRNHSSNELLPLPANYIRGQPVATPLRYDGRIRAYIHVKSGFYCGETNYG